jgi:arogenate dehydrogenase (NADP+)
MSPMKIGVYGLGRFGSFWAKVFAQTGKFEVLGYNRTPKREDDLPQGVRNATLEELCSADVLFLCVAISSVGQVLKTVAPLLSDKTVVMDTCSVKVYPVELMKSLLPEQIQFAATHPMFGPDSGRTGVKGLPIVFAPVRCNPDISQLWQEIFSDLLELNVISMTPAEHDREAAFTQGITHFVGRVLGELELKSSSIGTEGYQGLLHIIEQTCNDPMQLFYDLQKFNPYTHEMHTRLRKSIDGVMQRLDEADPEETS